LSGVGSSGGLVGGSISTVTTHDARALWSLLDDCHRIGVWPDSVQVPDGGLSTRLPTRCLRCGSLPVCNPSGTAGEAWLERGLPSS
jgi:hypothetical protein